MGELLLKGWKMLAESCPKCYCPYMQNKQGKRVWCGCPNEETTEQEKKDEISPNRE